MNFKLNCNKQNDSTCILQGFKNKRQRAFAEREQELLSLAEGLMDKLGFAALTMDKLVAACDYSKGTVYNHFSSKEDLLCALCTRSMETELALFERAMTFNGCNREKLLAVCFAYRLHALLNPTQFYCVLSAKTPAVMEKASAARLEHQQLLEQALGEVGDKIFEQAMSNAELPQSEQRAASQLTFAAWALMFGSNALFSAASEAQMLQQLDAEQSILLNINLLLDGMQFSPLSSEHDYAQSWQRISDQIFAEEVALVKRKVR
ncbi:TetR/AcrR family transcriptional regulator [Lacimicrobium alkaliphilum]|uniref:Transcriptional regulator n=1 Tax=Lacimicrobium alkaliphilum TaxID=1526571 RepID=A0ABQ1RE57_9ALTE|nr:TetR/AcrR family transcriptional regulator [Lacimicrobium alkaliphilum]GGD65405.1 transcriptional regulator [Lacimicrobium alkaliphilum]